MKKTAWTKADDKRVEKMRWRLQQVAPHYPARITLWGDRFKSDDEVIEWVMGASFDDMPPCSAPEDFNTCHKTLFLCAKG